MRKVSRASEQATGLNFRTDDIHEPYESWGERLPDGTLKNFRVLGPVNPHNFEFAYDDLHPLNECKHCGQKIEHSNHVREASAKTAGAWPSKIDHKRHLAEMNKLMDHHDQGEEWHAERGDLAQARKHAAAADALREAIYACTEAM
jgi:hypothetical protein